MKTTVELQRAAALAREGRHEEALALRDAVDEAIRREPRPTVPAAALPTMTVTYLPTGEQVTVTVEPNTSKRRARHNALKTLSDRIPEPAWVEGWDSGVGPDWSVLLRGVAK